MLEIYSREFHRYDQGGTGYLYHTNKGLLTGPECAELIGITPNRFNSRVISALKRGLSLTDKCITRSKSTHCVNKGDTGNWEWLSLSTTPRDYNVFTIKCGVYEEDLPDNFDPIKAEQFDRERWRMEYEAA